MTIGGRFVGICRTCGVICGENIGPSLLLVIFIFMLLAYKDASAVNPGICMMVILHLLSFG
jgi:hypothetical protein